MWLFRPLKLSPKLRKAKVTLLQNSTGQNLRVQTLRTKVEGSKTLRGKYWRQIRPAEFWTPALRSFGLLNLCPGEFWNNATFALRSFGDIVSEGKITTKNKKKRIFSYFEVIFVNLWNFRDLFNQYDHFLKKWISCWTVTLWFLE